jgi:aminoglycoside phosphotransferase (APT) family kinase protein
VTASHAVLRRLIHHLDQHQPVAAGYWQPAASKLAADESPVEKPPVEKPPTLQAETWQFTPLTGGMNNLLYRTVCPPLDLDVVIKFSLPGSRQCAAREFSALALLHRLGLRLAPAPILLDRQHFTRPVVAMTWVEGARLEKSPASETDWQKLVEYLAALRQVTPERSPFCLRPAVLNFASAEEGLQAVRAELERLPPAARRPQITPLIEALEKHTFPNWPAPPRCLCRCDPSPHNFLAAAQGLVSVDWENAGWGDPAFEIADLFSHPDFTDAPPERLAWAARTFAELTGDPGAQQRILAYFPILQVRWTLRWLRYLVEIPTGQDARLADWPEGWQVRFERQFEIYLQRAWQALSAHKGL